MPAEAGSLHCPNCGAAAASDARRCRYCQARLATISCPACFALMFDGAAFCPRCGARRERTEAEAAGVRCPACRGKMTRVSVGAAALLECAACDGVWLDAADFERICADREAQAAVVHRRTGSTPVAAAGGAVRYRRCPRCGKMMNRVNFARMSGTIVDVCRGDGTWLDAGELHAIVEFIQAGGMDRLRERELEELREEQRRLREMQAQAAASRDASSSMRRTWTGADLMSLLDALRKR